MANGYSNSDILNLFYIHGECQRIVSRTCRRFTERYPQLPPMTEKKFRRIEANFHKFGTSKAERKLPKPVTDSEENQITVLGYFYAFPHASIRSAEDDLGIPYSSIQRILKKHSLHGYKFITLQALLPEDAPRRVEFCEMMLIRTQEDPDFLKKVIWTDESKFSREGILNRRNCHFWASENPKFVRERGFQQKFSFNVFCLLMDNQVSFCIYDDNLNWRKYLEILRTTVTDFLDSLPLALYRSCWYQLDGAPAHCTNEISQELTNMFEDRWIRRLGPWSWPPRSPDLTPLDAYLWGAIKERVYKTPVETKEDLEWRVRQAFQQLNANEVRRATVRNVMESVHACLRANGQHFEQNNY